MGGEKRRLPIDDVARIIERDLSEGQYFVTGNLTREVFDDRCRFVDPTNDVVGLSRYLTALGLLFDPATSEVTVRSVEVTSPTTIESVGTLEGYLRFPWHPKVDKYTYFMTHRVDPDTRAHRRTVADVGHLRREGHRGDLHADVMEARRTTRARSREGKRAFARTRE